MLVPTLSADSPGSADRALTSAASSALSSVLRGPRRTGHVVAATRSLVAVVVDGPTPDLVCLTSSAGAELPCAMAVDCLVPSVQVGSVAVVGSGRLELPGLIVTPARWRPVRPPVLDDPAAAAARAARAAGCAPPDLEPVLLQRAGELSAALTGTRPSHTGLAGAVRALLGLGPGLTPAGDDILTGALVALRAARHRAARPLAAAVVTARPFARTTAVSAGLLRLAIRGLAVGQLTRFVEALGAPGADLAAARTALLGVGGTSGAAMYLGATNALRERTAT